jgi:cytochrome c553
MVLRAFLALAASAWMTATAVVALSQYRPPPPPVQPIAFSHKVHVATEGMVCLDCHTTATKEDQATIPQTATCMECHRTVGTGSPEIAKLLALDSKKEDVPWRRVYRVPEYVYFSHKGHASATPSITCDTCHGAVRELDVMQKLKDISMAACVDCHKQRSAPIGCGNICHDPKG